ncbi:MAG: DUF1573 domain-containing protein [Bacteroidota bacterium]
MKYIVLNFFFFCSILCFAQNSNPILVGDDIYINKSYLKINRIKNTETKIDSIIIYNKSNKTINFKLPESTDCVTISAKNTKIESKSNASIVFTIDGKKCKNFGFNNNRFNLKLSDSANAQILATWVLDEDFSLLTPLELKNAAKISIDKTTQSFDTVNQGDTLKMKFTIINKGLSNLLIRNLKPSCGCTLTKISNEEIKPSDSAFITAELNTDGFAGSIAKTISIVSNDPSNPTMLLFIKAFVRINEELK